MYIKVYMLQSSFHIFFFFFFFYYQQFITRLAVEDRGSYFRNYVQRKQTNMN